ncbi:DinB family protein [soil metagenome]
MATETTSINLITADTLLQNWQGHRRLTRKTIEAFPEDKLFQFSVGGMRTFGELALEFIGMAVPIVDGVSTGKWEAFQYASKPESKSDLLRLWDTQTPLLDEKFPTIPAARFEQVDKAFGQWEMTGIAMIQYAIDNEIHHRGQGYVYLRALGIEPPPFWERN